MIFLIAGVALFFLFKSDIVGDTLNKGDFAVTLYSSLRRHLDTQPALLAAAMGVYESGYGTAAAYIFANNVFNITAGSAWIKANKPVFLQDNADDEYAADGTKTRIAQTWRKYASLDASVDDYISFLSTQNSGRYVKAYNALIRADSYNFVNELYNAGYFTLAPDSYLRGVAGAYNTVKDMVGIS